MKDRVLIYEKDAGILRSLKSFFKKRKDFRAEFVGDLHSLERIAASSKARNIVCLVPVDELPRLKTSGFFHPVIATIPGAPSAGIVKAVAHGADHYLVRPIYGADVEFKIRTCLDGRKAIECLKRETNDLQTLVDLTNLLSSTLDPREILYLIVKKISEIIPVTRCSIIRVIDEGTAVVVSSFEDPKVGNWKLDLKKYPEIRKALISRRPVVISDVARDPIMKRVKRIIASIGIRSIMVVPIVFREEIIGTLFLRTSRTECSFSESEVSLCNALANSSANSLYNAFLFEKIEGEKSRIKKLAVTDYMTGIYNIRYFYHRLGEEFSRSQRYGFHLSCLMLDIDFFKGINDRHGHKVGDLILREFAQVLNRHARKSDVLARYGGEEFIMLLPQTSKEGAASKAEALRVYVENYRFRGLKGEGGLTVSIGVSAYPGHRIEKKEDLITFADNALYAAKASGRNRVAVYKP